MRRPTSILNRLTSRASKLDGFVPALIPEARRIGEGYARTAYRVGAYVIKDGRFNGSDNARRPPLRVFRRLGVLPPQEWRRNGWLVQPFYRLNRNSPHHDRFENEWEWDLHRSNVGFDRRGRAVAFDW